VTESPFWTNPSVRGLASGRDPIKEISSKAKSLVYRAVENGWQGPPFDPFWLAQYCGLSVSPSDDVSDARLTPTSRGKSIIEYNPNQSRSRVRFSIAHEIAHTLFPDFMEATRNRLLLSNERTDEWQLELLCNVAAAEILMPSESISKEISGNLDIKRLRALWNQFEVSPEAFLIRAARLTSQPISIFSASLPDDRSGSNYRLDYCIPSSSSKIVMTPGVRIPQESCLKDCTAIGFTAKGRECWGTTEVVVECVGVPPYPGRIFPRVVGLLHPFDAAINEQLEILYVLGDVTLPRGEGNKIVAHVVNDKASTWGAGAARAIGKRWPLAQSDFRNWTMARRQEFELGKTHEFRVSDGLTIVSMVAQHGYGDSTKPRIRYSSLKDGLEILATVSSRNNASVHMPRIGTGFAGGNWRVIEDMIIESLIARGIRVVVYDLPRGGNSTQTFLESVLTETELS
jgi:uncharacterized protein DUF955